MLLSSLKICGVVVTLCSFVISQQLSVGRVISDVLSMFSINVQERLPICIKSANKQDFSFGMMGANFQFSSEE